MQHPSLQLSPLTSRPTQIHTLRLIREPSIHTKRRVHIPRNTLLLVNLLQLAHILVVKRDELLVLVDAGRGYGFGEDGGVARDWVIVSQSYHREW
jgi:hypothetical protein